MFTVAAKLHGKKQKKYSFYSKLKSPLKIGKGRNLWVKLVKRRTLPIVYSFLSVVGLNDKQVLPENPQKVQNVMQPLNETTKLRFFQQKNLW